MAMLNILSEKCCQNNTPQSTVTGKVTYISQSSENNNTLYHYLVDKVLGYVIQTAQKLILVHSKIFNI